MDFDQIFRSQLDTLKAEGNYRTFAELDRKRGSFPRADNHKDGKVAEVTVWCSNDYLGMGQHPDVVKAMVDCVQACGTGAGGEHGSGGTGVEKIAAGHGVGCEGRRPDWRPLARRRNPRIIHDPYRRSPS